MRNSDFERPSWQFEDGAGHYIELARGGANFGNRSLEKLV